MNDKSYYVYILANRKNGTLYTGVTNNIKRRIFEHKNHLMDGFTDKYNVNTLVYFEENCIIYAAIRREKQIKKWNRDWKINLIEKTNPKWNDLATEWYK
jgi:putative endonuclease